MKVNKEFKNLCLILEISTEQAKDNCLTEQQLKDIIRVRVELTN